MTFSMQCVIGLVLLFPFVIIEPTLTETTKHLNIVL